MTVQYIPLLLTVSIQSTSQCMYVGSRHAQCTRGSRSGPIELRYKTLPTPIDAQRTRRQTRHGRIRQDTTFEGIHENDAELEPAEWAMPRN
ncbi:hypothetical protein B0T10DRAFT_258096 [Thelonectria olida]|uniref:Uncharacterized protein n=1 Tax=Thelonectria olida TaxID=1576542 RepID=A0A9P8WEF4_9HYPO|nr:hypothetical protein B0T10DRAFT_258096 [Thelonectria olida]